ncbi:MAG: EamA family transporter [Eubacteriales bacterium]
MNNTLIYFVVIAMTLIGSVAAVLLKRTEGAKTLIALISSKYLYLGGALYFITALMNIYALRYLPYTTVLPLTSITYIWTMIFARICFKERIGIRKICGLSLIIIGAILIF